MGPGARVLDPFDELVATAGLDPTDPGAFRDRSTAAWNDHVADTTEFDDWPEMLAHALERYLDDGAG